MKIVEFSNIFIPKANITARYKDIPKISPRKAIKEEINISNPSNNTSLCTTISFLYITLNIPFKNIKIDIVIYSVKTVLYVIVKLRPISNPNISPNIE